MYIPAHIFRKYDIRGIYPTELNEVAAEEIGKAFGSVIRRKGLQNCVLGYDDRESSPSLSKAVTKGLLETGCNVTDVGITLTPLIHFYTSSLSFDGGIMITASHNPKKYNGIKLEFRHAEPYALENLQSLRNMVEEWDYESGDGSYNKTDLTELYVSHLKQQLEFKSKLKIILDCGNGATSLIAPRVFSDLGCPVVPMNCSIDGEFPHGVPNPEDEEFIKGLSAEVVKAKADLGIAFDTDGDRVGFVDEKGVFYRNDLILLVLAKDILKKSPGSKVLFDVKCSEIVPGVIKSLGGVPEMVKTGRATMLEEMKKGAILGAEFSGHTYISHKYFGFDDGIYAALRLVRIMEENKAGLQELTKDFPKVSNTPEIKVPIDDSKKDEVVEKVSKLVSSDSDIIKIITLDGIRAYISQTGWFLIRSSGTSPYLSIRLEGKDPVELSLVQEKLDKILQSCT